MIEMDDEHTQKTGKDAGTFRPPLPGDAGEHQIEPAGPPLEDQVFSIESHWFFKVVGWVGLLYWLAAIVWTSSLLKTDPLIAYVFDAFILMPVFLLLMARQSIYIDREKFVIVRLIGCYRIYWHEIVKIGIDTLGQRMVFYGKDKWLVMPRVSTFVSGRRVGLVDYINAIVRTRHIPVEFSDDTPRKSKNTMISYI